MKKVNGIRERLQMHDKTGGRYETKRIPLGVFAAGKDGDDIAAAEITLERIADMSDTTR